MASSVMNGRLRLAPPPPSPRSASSSSAVSSSFSVAPATMPSGTIAVHEASSGDEEDENGHSCFGPSPRRRRFSIRLRSVHSLRRDAVVDHAWSSFPADVGGGGEGTQEAVEILAVLTRGGSTVEVSVTGEEVGGRPGEAGSVGVGASEEGDEGRPAAGASFSAGAAESAAPSSVCLYRVDRAARFAEANGRSAEAETPPFSTETFPAASSELTLVRTIDLRCFATSVSAGRDALAIGKSNGVDVYSLRSLLGLRPTSNDATDDGGIGGDGAAAKDRSPPMSPPAEIARSHAAHAATVSHPYLAVASGDRVGIWSVEELLAESSSRSRTTLRGGGAVPSAAAASAAIWSARIEGCGERVTSVALSSDGSILALSCWDGSAFAFRRTIGRRGASPTWERIRKFGEAPPWEGPSLADAARPSGQFPPDVFPTFVALRPSRGGWQNDLLAVSVPNRCAARIFDLDTGERLDDVAAGPSANATKGDELSTSKAAGSNQVHGMITAHFPIISGSHGKLPKPATLLWIDGLDALRARSFPERTVRTLLPSLPPTKTYKFPVSISGTDGTRRSDAWLVREAGNASMWSLEFSHWTSSSADGGDDDATSLDLSFLCDEDAVALAAVRRSAGRDDDGPTGPSSSGSGSFVTSSDEYLGVFVEAVDTLYVYGRSERGWKAVDCASGGGGDDGRVGVGSSFDDGSSERFVARFLGTKLAVGLRVARPSSDDDDDAAPLVRWRVWDLDDAGDALNGGTMRLEGDGAGDATDDRSEIVVGEEEDPVQFHPIDSGGGSERTGFAVSIRAVVRGRRGVFVCIVTDALSADGGDDDGSTVFVPLDHVQGDDRKNAIIVSCTRVSLDEVVKGLPGIVHKPDLERKVGEGGSAIQSPAFDVAVNFRICGAFWQYVPKLKLWRPFPVEHTS